MTKIHIGGHREHGADGPGVEVYRTDKGILKEAFTPADVEGLLNEARMLEILSETGIAPELWDVGEDWILQEDLGDTQSVNDGEHFRQNGVRLLWELQKAGIRHGDLTGVNLITTNDVIKAIDFQQSNLFSEPPPQKRPLCDSFYIWRYILGTPSEMHPTPDTPRVLRRWLSVLGSLTGYAPNRPMKGKTFLDLGCFQGDFCALAAVEGMETFGIDQGGFQEGKNSIEEGKKLWGEFGIKWKQQNIIDTYNFDYDVVMMFSTWPYIVKDFGTEVAFNILTRIMNQCGVLFFETQLKGDGPGPDFLLEDTDVANMLGQWGKVQALATVPVTGRPAERTVWRVER